MEKSESWLLFLFHQLGEYAPFILIFATILLLHKKPYFQFYYIVFLFVNTLLNTFLKQLIQQPRPSVDKKHFARILEKNKKYVSSFGFPYGIYGMPSGHAQSVFFSTAYAWFTFRNVPLVIIFSLLSLLSICQRVVYNHHTVMQVIVGSLVGLMVGSLAYRFARQTIGGKFSGKKDDFGGFV